MTKIQYTLRNIPLPVDQALRKRARQQGKSFNQTAVEALMLNVLGTTKPKPLQMKDLFGVGAELLDDEFDIAIAEQSKIDPKLWQ
ncbi:MAG: hypothetical protein ABI220_00310 [Candidatus Saccharimonadales bacterium]